MKNLTKEEKTVLIGLVLGVGLVVVTSIITFLATYAYMQNIIIKTFIL